MSESEQHVQQRRWRRRTVRMLVDWSSGTTARCDYATTLGAGGLFIETDEPLPRGTPFKARFRLPGTGALHEVEGRVAWAHVPRPGDTHSPGMGVEFTDPTTTSRLARELEALPD